MLHSFFNPDEAYRKAQEANQAGWDQAQGFEKPFWQHGLDQYGNLMGAEGALMDPAKLESQWAQGYETSPYAKQMLAQNQSSGLDAASSMGLMGSSGALQNIQTGAGNIVNQDRQQYMNDLMQKYLQGIGIGQNIYNTGAQMGSQLGQQAQRFGENQAGLKYGEYAAPGQQFGNILGMGVDALANYFGGGMFGGSGNYAPTQNAALTPTGHM